LASGGELLTEAVGNPGSVGEFFGGWGFGRPRKDYKIFTMLVQNGKLQMDAGTISQPTPS